MIVTNKKIKVKDFLFIVGLSLLSNRSFALFCILGSISISSVINDFIEEKRIDLRKIFKNRIVYVCLFTFFLSSIFVMINYNKRKEYIDVKDYPVSAVKYIKENLDLSSLRMYNDYNYGSYLLFNDIKVFVDSRSDLYTRGFNDGCTIFMDAMDIEKKYNEVFKKYNINHVITYKDSMLNRLLVLDNNYINLYSDSILQFIK